ncbi:histidine kinase [Algoriphagus sp.]|uniref:histidine kinase n=1 Tax=Algoriphagus sp. TaxID=1872435 RepID=UPI0025D14545|nr:histidine kinase [Algoriphagus sp.]
MDSKFWDAYVNYYTITIDCLLIIGIYFFLKLPKEKKANSTYWLPLLIIGFSVFYEAFGAYANYNFEFKKAVNAFLGNTENPKYNIWIYNITNKQISTLLNLLLIKKLIEPTKKIYLRWMIIFFIMVAIILQLTGVEPLYLNQPIIAVMAASMILIGSGLYFIGLISNEQYLNSKPIHLISFWLMTFLLFTYSLTYINSVARIYIYEINPQIALSLAHIDRILGIFLRLTLLLIIISPMLPKVFNKEPSFEFKSSKKPGKASDLSSQI